MIWRNELLFVAMYIISGDRLKKRRNLFLFDVVRSAIAAVGLNIIVSYISKPLVTGSSQRSILILPVACGLLMYNVVHLMHAYLVLTRRRISHTPLQAAVIDSRNYSIYQVEKSLRASSVSRSSYICSHR